MKKYVVVIHPIAEVYGSINVPEDVENIREYIDENFDDIDFSYDTAEFGYDSDFDIYEEEE